LQENYLFWQNTEDDFLDFLPKIRVLRLQSLKQIKGGLFKIEITFSAPCRENRSMKKLEPDFYIT